MDNALQYCVGFCRALYSGCGSIQEVIKKYENLMIGRGRRLFENYRGCAKLVGSGIKFNSGI